LSTKILSGTLINSALANGIQIDCIPFIETVQVTGNALQNKIRTLVTEHATVIFTSGVAVKAVADLLQRQPNWEIFCIQGQTCKNVKAGFPGSGIVATAKDAEGLADKVIASGKVKKVIFFCGNRRMDQLPAKLSDNGIIVDEFVVYETNIKPQIIAKAYKAILFYSPSGVESFFSVNSVQEGTKIFSIGPSTTRALKKYSSVIVEAETPDAKKLLNLATDLCK